MDHSTFRKQFPVCERVAYLNAGTCGPLSHAGAAAGAQAAAHALHTGRALEYYEQLIETRDKLRAAYAATIGAQARDISITTSTSDGMVRVLLALGLRAGDEVLAATHEHPGLLGPLAALRRRTGIVVREVALEEIAEHVTPATRLVACSHVAWTTGALAPPLHALPEGVPLLLDGAQGAGAVPVAVESLGCAFYAASGQKWLCGPVGTGFLWVAPAWRDRVASTGPTYMNLEVPALGLEASPWADGRAHDAAALSLESLASALAALDVLGAFGWDEVQRRGPALAAELAERLAEAGREVLPRGDTTLVSWRSGDPAAEVVGLKEAGVVVRDFPGLPLVRAAVGAWNDQSDVGRLLGGLSAS